MIKRVVSIAVILITTFVLSLVYREDAPMRLLAMELIIIGIAFAIAVLNVCLIRLMVWSCPAKMKINGDNKSSNIMLSFAGCIFLLPIRIEVVFELRNAKSDKIQKLKVLLNISHGQNKALIPISPGSVGLIYIRPVRMRVYEPAGILGLSKKIKSEKRSILVFPTSYPLQINNCMGRNYYSFGDETTDYYRDHPGDDPTEIFEHREYLDGDKLSRVNWKLSARENKLMVKEMSDPIREPMCIVLGVNTDSISIANNGITALTSLAHSLLYAEVRFAVLIFNNQSKQIKLVHVKDDESLDEATTELLISDNVLFDDFDYIMKEGSLDTYSNIIYISAYDRTAFDKMINEYTDVSLKIFAITDGMQKSDDSIIVLHNNDIEYDLKKLWLDIR